jgi:hypothetical protein
MYYLTPSQLRAYSPIDLSDKIDAELAVTISRATAAVNDHCNVPTLPVPHNLLGGTITGETHTWDVDPYSESPQVRVFPYHRPVIDVALMRIYVTTTQYVDFSQAELYYEMSEGWIEPASLALTSYGLFGSSMLPFVGLSQPHAMLDYTYGRLIPVEDRLWYQGQGGYVWSGESAFWTSDPVTVRVGGVVANAADYTVDRTEGSVTWTNMATVPSGTDTVEAEAISRQHPNVRLATAITSVQFINDRQLLEQGMPLGIREFQVAEVRVARDYRRTAGRTEPEPIVPAEAADLLAPFVFRAVAWA